MAVGKTKEYVNVLHMSDFHYDHTLYGTDADMRNAVLEACLRSLRTIDKKVDVIVLTGDIALSGSLEDYEAFHDNFLKNVLNIFDLDVTKVLICPGNHDVKRGETTPEEDIITRSKSDVGPHTIKAAYAGIFSGLTTYMTNHKYPKYGISIDLTKDKSREYLAYLYGCRTIKGLNFICLNSSWNCRNEKDARFGDDYGKLFLLREFVADALRAVPKKTSENTLEPVNVAITHHPFFFDSTRPQKVMIAPTEVGQEPSDDIFISNEYQWLDKGEVMDILSEREKNEHQNIFRPIHQIERNISLVLAGHMHKAVGPLVVGTHGTSGYIAGSLDPKKAYKKCEFQLFQIERDTGDIVSSVFGCDQIDGAYFFSEGRPIRASNLHDSANMLEQVLLKTISDLEFQKSQHRENPKEETPSIEGRENTPLRISYIKGLAKKDLKESRERLTMHPPKGGNDFV